MLCYNPADQFRRGDVKSWAIARHLGRSRRWTEPPPDLIRVPLFDRDARTVRNREIERAARGGDVERNPVLFSKNSHTVSSDLVGNVDVSRDPVRTRNYQYLLWVLQILMIRILF